MTYWVMEMLLWMACIIIVLYRTKYTQRKTKWFMGSNGINVQTDINHCVRWRPFLDRFQNNFHFTMIQMWPAVMQNTIFIPDSYITPIAAYH
jgi:hypothetical protein